MHYLHESRYHFSTISTQDNEQKIKKKKVKIKALTLDQICKALLSLKIPTKITLFLPNHHFSNSQTSTLPLISPTQNTLYALILHYQPHTISSIDVSEDSFGFPLALLQSGSLATVFFVTIIVVVNNVQFAMVCSRKTHSFFFSFNKASRHIYYLRPHVVANNRLFATTCDRK